MLTAALLTMAKKRRQPKRPLIDECIKQMWCVCTHAGVHVHVRARACTHTQWNITQLQKRKEILPFPTTGMDLQHIMLSETSQMEKDKRQIPYGFTSMWNLKTKKDTEKEKEMKEQTHWYKEQSVSCQGAEGEEIKGTSFQLWNKQDMGMQCTT